MIENGKVWFQERRHFYYPSHFHFIFHKYGDLDFFGKVKDSRVLWMMDQEPGKTDIIVITVLL